MVRSENPTLNHHWTLLSRIFTHKRVGQKLSHYPPLIRLLLQTTLNKTSKLFWSLLRQARWLSEVTRVQHTAHDFADTEVGDFTSILLLTNRFEGLRLRWMILCPWR